MLMFKFTPALSALTICALLSIPRGAAHSQETVPSSAKVRSTLAATIPKFLAAKAASLGDGAMIGIAIVDGTSGELLFEKNATQGFVAASNAKLITTAAALALLGPSFQFRTELLAKSISPSGSIRGDLYIRGRGNALFDDADMARLVRRLKAQGVTRIDGQIIVDNSYFDSENLPPHFNEQPTETAAFRAPIAATSFNFNAFAIHVRPALAGHGPTRIEVRPACDYLSIVNTSSTITTGRSRLVIDSTDEAGRLRITISGQLRKEVARRRFRKRAPNPVLFVGSGLRRALADAGIAVRKKHVEAGMAPEGSLVLATHQGPALATMVRGMGKYSNNFVAELLLKVIGAEVKAAGAPATWNHGLMAVHEFLASAGLSTGSYRYENGSGLFDSNRFSPLQLTTILQLAHRNARWGSDFFSSLAIAAFDGTLHGRMKDSEAAGFVRAKTGTLDQASALSGVAAIDGRNPLFFSILINGFSENAIGTARGLQDEIAIELMRTLRAQ